MNAKPYVLHTRRAAACLFLATADVEELTSAVGLFRPACCEAFLSLAFPYDGSGVVRKAPS